MEYYSTTKKEHGTIKWYNTDEPWKLYAKQNPLGAKGHMWEQTNPHTWKID